MQQARDFVKFVFGQSMLKCEQWIIRIGSQRCELREVALQSLLPLIERHRHGFYTRLRSCNGTSGLGS
jgi:hypothetical protein